MADEFIPELTLNPNSPLAGQGQAAAAPAPAAASTPPAEAHLPESDLDEAKLSPAQRKAVEDFARTIDITDSNVVLQYGAAAQKNVSEFSENTLQQIRTKDLGQIGETLADLELTRMISLQMGPQTRMLQNNDTLMIEKIQSSLVNTIPLWKSQMVLALGLEHARQATAAQNAVTEMTNNLLRQNADLLKTGTIDTAREAERSIVDLETLRHTNQQLMESLDEVLRIQTEGTQKRREAEAELGRIEGELKQKLLALRT